ncbi:MAG: hypothetical protein K5662_05515 [Lachnospiraceae bacterium]|nr:hypothetical protein [Lachnospiraceae bacterium]
MKDKKVLQDKKALQDKAVNGGADNRLRTAALFLSIMNLVLQIIVTILTVFTVYSFIAVTLADSGDLTEDNLTGYMSVLSVAALVICVFVLIIPSISILRAFLKKNPKRLRGTFAAYIVLAAMAVFVVIWIGISARFNVWSFLIMLSGAVFMAINVMLLKEIMAIDSLTAPKGSYMKMIIVMAAVDFILFTVISSVGLGLSGVREILAMIVYCFVWNALLVMVYHWIYNLDSYDKIM